MMSTERAYQLRVKRIILTVRRWLPVFPHKQTISQPVATSQKCQERKHSQPLRKAAARSAETICVTIGEILRAFTPTECANYFRNSGYAQS